MLRLGCAAILVLMFAIPAVAAHYLPWWGVILVLIGQVFVLLRAGPALIKYGAKRVFMRLFLTKSRVLKGAKVEVHEVRLTARPARRRQLDSQAQAAGEQREEITAADGTIVTTPVGSETEPDADEDGEPDEETKNNRYVLIDFTITPPPASGQMQFYDPSELLLVPFNSRISPTEDPAADGVSASAHDLTLIDESGGATKDFDKLTGPSHLRVTFQCPQSLRGRVKFRYYFEAFGDLTLPGNGSTPTPFPESGG
jgi:hypothetical protein